VCALSIGLFDMPLWLVSLTICGSGIGIGGCQSGVNALSGGIYPSTIRSTGAGWALGLGRVGTVAGPLLGGGLLMLGWHAQGIFMAAALPTFGAMLLMAILGRVRGRW
jgi:MFS transporter, AAHS family, 4-hydroxybenzoate transporter